MPGCATGEEVYSIAMCLLERTAELSHNPSLQIFATDLSEGALAKAREGTYLVNIARDVSAERLRRFFAKVGGHYQISKAIREMCVFARHDLTRDPPYSRIDLISCRNVLIYLEPRLQERVFATFHYALRPEGFLVDRAGGDRRRLLGAVLRGRREAQDLLAESGHRPAALPLRACATRARHGRALRSSPRRPRASRRCPGRRTGCCWPGSGPPAWWSTRDSASSSSEATPIRSSSTATDRPA